MTNLLLKQLIQKLCNEFATTRRLLSSLLGQFSPLGFLNNDDGEPTPPTFSETVQLISDRLSEDCTGDPINVHVCNQIDLSSIEGSLSSILTAVQNIDVNTDGIETQLAQLIVDVQAGNTTVANALSVLNDILVELQAINLDTSAIEALLTSTQTLLQSEFDETQVLLQSLLDKLNAPCGTAQKVEVCPLTSSVSEVKVCVDGKPGIRRVTVLSDGTETIEFLDKDGAVVVPAAWSIGCCDTTFATQRMVGSIVVPTLPADTCSVTIHNPSGATLELVTNIGTVTVMAGSFITLSGDSLSASAFTIIASTIGGSDVITFNYEICA